MSVSKIVPEYSQNRPQSFRMYDDMGRVRTLSSGAAAYELFLPAPATSKGILLLGIGPYPRDIPFADAETVFYLESPDFEAAMPSDWQAGIPASWRRADLDSLTDLARSCAVWRYRQGIRLFGSFWSPLLAHIQAARLGPAQATPSRSVIVPGSEHDLLTVELNQGLREAGMHPVPLPPDSLAEQLPALLRNERPAFMLSVNGRGLDADGFVFHLLQAAGIPVAIWIVDNPWHVLSAWKQLWWRDAYMFVTDAGFIPELKQHGARHVAHLPLGAWMPPGARFSGSKLRPLVFVGRSAFPDKQKFFSGLHLEPRQLEQARFMLEGSTDLPLQRPDFFWWTSNLGLTSLWPGTAVRQAGFGAETCSQLYRTLWIKAAHDVGLTLFGDDGWRELLGSDHARQADIRPPLDYYASLSSVYASARYSLNLTSLLLPSGLTQRHFDVWTSGGFLLTDATPGLSIFPTELTDPIRVANHRELSSVVTRFERDPALYNHLQDAWKHCLREHTVTQRILHMIRFLHADTPPRP